MKTLSALTVVAVFLLVLTAAEPALAQEPLTVFRSDEVGPATWKIDEEGFLNILSYQLPIESELPWTLADRGYRVTLGSLDQSKLWHDQELRIRAKLNDSLSVMVHAVGSVDFDSYYVYIQPILEWEVFEGGEILFPTSVEFDKGYFNFGLGFRWRAPESGIDYLQLTWVRADALFGSHQIDYDKTKVNDPADTFEFQGMGRLGDLGTSRLKVAWLTKSSFTYEDLDQTEEFERLYAHWIHRVDLSPSVPLFFEFETDDAEEALLTGEPDVREDEFEGKREYYRFRTECHFTLAEETAERIRGGLQYLYYMQDEDLPNKSRQINKSLTGELTVYGGYRYPFTDSFSLEGIIYAMWRNARQRYPNSDFLDDRYDHSFQAKLNLQLRWDLSESATFILIPSFELDSFGWGGGGFQLTYMF